jgi:hypothetical protein
MSGFLCRLAGGIIFRTSSLRKRGYGDKEEIGEMRRRKKTSRQKRDLKAVKRLARRMRVPPTRAHDPKNRKRRRNRKLEEHLRDQGWI